MVFLLMGPLCGVSAASWTLAVGVVELPLAERFTIARESWDVAANVFVAVSFDGITGVGESSPDAHWGESTDSVVAQLGAVDLGAVAGPFDLETVGELLPPGAARAALDIALHDLAAKRAGISVAELLGVGNRRLPRTSVTVPISDRDTTVARARRLADHPVLKMKVGFDRDVDAVRAVRDVFDGTLRIDANEGWDVATAVARLRMLTSLDIELCEQPIPSGDRDGLRRVTDSSPIAIYADEDACTATDVARLAGAVHGVNLKLRKAGGVRETCRAITVARALDLGVMLGCDLESGVAATAEASVAALVDKADLDGPLLLEEDPFPGVSYSRGEMTLPRGPGLGLSREPVL
jgi:L-alanine-DL-glutamate epimerase-like enolase superfamily enzyme